VHKRQELRLYALDLGGSIRTVKPKNGIAYSVHKRSGPVGMIESSRCERRFAKGDRAIVAYIKHNPVAYLFAATTDTWVGEIEDWLSIVSKEVYFYDAFTAVRYRGRGIYPSLLCRGAAYFKKRGYRHAVIFSTARNRDSIKGIEGCGFSCYETVDYRNFFGLKTWYYRVGERYVKTRLGNEE
jgi:GNAT superfamily N-acetyltransferase